MRFKINDQSVKYFTGKAYLISIPKSDYAFWLTAKCCYEGINRGYTIYLNEDYTYYTAKKKGKAKGKISGEELIDKFSDYQFNVRTRPEVIKTEHVPEDVEPVKEVKVDKSLLRDDSNV